MHRLKIVFLLALCKLSFGGCAGGKPLRKVYAFSSPASLTTVMLSNPSSVSQSVTVTISAKGNEEIYNQHVFQKFGVCTGVSGTPATCTWSIPNGSSLSCDSSYKQCNATFTLAVGSVKRLGFGSLLNMPACNFGCPPLRFNSPDAGSSIEISTCDEANTGTGFIHGWIDLFFDVADTDLIVPINGGRLF